MERARVREPQFASPVLTVLILQIATCPEGTQAAVLDVESAFRCPSTSKHIPAVCISTMYTVSGRHRERVTTGR